MQRPKWRHAGVLAGLALLSSAALADIRVGVTVSATGPQASLGQPRRTQPRCGQARLAAKRST